MAKLPELLKAEFFHEIPLAINIAIILSPIIFWWFRREWKLLGTPANKSIETRIQWLEDNKIPNAYQHGLNKLLDLIERWFGKASVTKPCSFMDRFFGIQPWTALSFERLMLLAVVYPVLFLILGWLFGNTGALGEFVVLEPSPFSTRTLLVLLLMGEIFSLYRFINNSGMRFNIWLIVAFFFAGAVAGAFTFAVAVAGAVAIAVTVSGFVFISGAGVVSISGTLAVAIAGAGAIAIAIAVTVAGAFMFVFKKLRNKVNTESSLVKFWVFAWLFLFIYLCGAAILIVYSGDSKRIQDAFTLLLFLGFLPLFNAPFDWLSFGFTRGLLYSIGTKEHGWLRVLIVSLLDVVIAVVFLILVAASTLLALMLVNWLAKIAGAEAVIHLPSLWQQLQSGEWQKNMWIWLMLGSTLIPTLVHFVVAVFALLVVLPHAPAEKAAQELMRARVEFLNGNDKAVVGEDERRTAFIFTILRQMIVLVFTSFMIWLIYFLLLEKLPGWFGSLIQVFGHVMNGS